jgi:hypothetical protein
MTLASGSVRGDRHRPVLRGEVGRAPADGAEDGQRASAGPPVSTPLLYLPGERERRGDIGAYVQGLRDPGGDPRPERSRAGRRSFHQEDASGETWRLVASFAKL